MALTEITESSLGESSQYVVLYNCTGCVVLIVVLEFYILYDVRRTEYTYLYLVQYSSTVVKGAQAIGDSACMTRRTYSPSSKCKVDTVVLQYQYLGPIQCIYAYTQIWDSRVRLDHSQVFMIEGNPCAWYVNMCAPFWMGCNT